MSEFDWEQAAGMFENAAPMCGETRPYLERLAESIRRCLADGRLP